MWWGPVFGPLWEGFSSKNLGSQPEKPIPGGAAEFFPRPRALLPTSKAFWERFRRSAEVFVVGSCPARDSGLQILDDFTKIHLSRRIFKCVSNYFLVLLVPTISLAPPIFRAIGGVRLLFLEGTHLRTVQVMFLGGIA